MKKKKKILYFITKASWGGAGRHVYDLAINLPQEDFDVVIVLGKDGELKNKLESQHIRVITIHSLQRDISIIREIKTFWQLIKILRQEKPDILHSHSSKAGGLGAFAGRIMRVPKIIFTAHGWAFNEERNFFSRLAIYFFHWLTIIFSHTTIAVSHHTKEQAVIKMPFIKNKIVVVHNGIAPILFKDRNLARDEIFANHKPKNIDPHALWIGTISELHKNKGLDYIIRAIGQLLRTNTEKLPSFIFVIIGSGEEKENLEKLIIKEKLQDIVFLVGYKKNASLLLKAFDIFTLTSRTEAFPYALLEAGLAGLPVIASDVGGIPEILIKDSGILVQQQNLATWGDNPQVTRVTRAILRMLKNKEERIQFRLHLKTHVTRSFPLQILVKKVYKYY
ncbi:glycosyltransferase, partial [Patescibacteria group bacterium]|nr:glycosyltransferase [Patescibacteria group bacterium]